MSDSSDSQVLRHTGGFCWTNAYAFEAAGGWICVDAPADTAPWLRQQGIRLAALLLTHAHFDHVEEAATIREEHGCEIFAWETSTPESRLETFVQMSTGMTMSVASYPVDHILAGQDLYAICGWEFHLAHIPGHSADSVSFYDPIRGRVFSGDTLMQGALGRTDFPGGSEKMLLAGIKRHLLSLPEATVVFPGHGQPTTVAEGRKMFRQLGWL